MKPYIASFINALILISFGLWAYFTSENPSMTALIPVIIGGILLVMVPGVKKEAKIPAHIAVTLTLIVAIALFKPLSASIAREDVGAIIRSLVMLISSVVALIDYIKGFIAARKLKNQDI